MTQNPLIVWNDLGEKTASYDISLFNKNGEKQLSMNLDRKKAWCNGETCSVALLLIPQGNDYRVEVSPENGSPDEASSIIFSTSDFENKIQLISPSIDSEISENKFQVSWSILHPVPDGIFQLILVNSVGTEMIYGPLKCGDNQLLCSPDDSFSAKLENIKSGSYIWYIEEIQHRIVSEPALIKIK